MPFAKSFVIVHAQWCCCCFVSGCFDLIIVRKVSTMQSELRYNILVMNLGYILTIVVLTEFDPRRGTTEGKHTAV